MIWLAVALATVYAAAVIWDSIGSRVVTAPQPIKILNTTVSTVQVRYRVKGRRRVQAPLTWCLLALAISGCYATQANAPGTVGALLWLGVAGRDLFSYIERAS